MVAAEIAAALDLPLEVTVVRKLGAPLQPELAIGAMAEDGSTWLNLDLIQALQVSQHELLREQAFQSAEIRRQLKLFRSDRPLDIKGRQVLLVDDGLATGATAIAAARFLRKSGCSSLYLGVPVAATQTVEMIRGMPEVDLIFAERIVPQLGSVGQWYEEFEQVSDSEVQQVLRDDAGRGRWQRHVGGGILAN